MLVTVVTPVYNSIEKLRYSVESVASQGVDAFEYIIVDDGSEEHIADVLQSLLQEYSWLKVITLQKNSGAAAARNIGIEAAKGRYIAFLDSDDLWLPGKLEAQVGFMQREGVAFSYGDYERRDRASGALLGSFTAPERVCYRDLLRGCPIGCLTAAYDQEALGKVYMPDVRRGQDWGLWLALTRLGGPARKYPGLHAIYHTGGESLSANKVAKARDIYRIYREQERLSPLSSCWFLMHHVISSLRK